MTLCIPNGVPTERKLLSVDGSFSLLMSDKSEVVEVLYERERKNYPIMV